MISIIRNSIIGDFNIVIIFFSCGKNNSSCTFTKIDAITVCIKGFTGPRANGLERLKA